MEELIYRAMVKKLKDFQTIRGGEDHVRMDPRLAAYQVELEQVQDEIEKLIDTLMGASSILISYANRRIEELDSRKQELSDSIAKLSLEMISPEQVREISGYLDSWDEVDFDDKRRVLDLMVSAIYATSDNINILWKI